MDDGFFALTIAILLATIIVPVVMFVLLFIKGGRVVKNPIGFGVVQAYSIGCSITMFITRGSKLNFAGVILGFLLILISVGTAFVKKYDFFMARIANAVLVILSTLAFWYLEWHVIMLFLVVIIILAMGFIVYLQKKNNFVAYKRKPKKK